jgi:hypothetical protein
VLTKNSGLSIGIGEWRKSVRIFVKGPPIVRNARLRPLAPHFSDGPNMVVLLIALALVMGLLVGLGARELARHHDTLRRPGRGELSAGASELGYKTERDFRIDSERADLALIDVLAGQPGSQRLWENAETGNRGIVWASEELPTNGGASCRSLARRTMINGVFRNGAGVACRTSSGGWEQKGEWRSE